MEKDQPTKSGKKFGYFAIGTIAFVLVLICAFFVFGTHNASAVPNFDITNNQVTIWADTGPGGPYDIPSTFGPYPVVAIGDRAFMNSTTLLSVTIPDSVTMIGNESFSGCTGLQYVTIGSGVTYIGSSAFSNCTRLISVTIPNSVTTVGTDAFYGCIALKSVTIGSGLTIIDRGAFQGCTALTSVTIGTSVKTIGVMAFSGCSALTSMTIPSSVTDIDNAAFGYCSALTSMNFLGSSAPFVQDHSVMNSYLDWIVGTSPSIKGHAPAASNFPAPGNNFHTLMMGTNLDPSATHFLVSVPYSAPSGTSFSITVTALDQYNNIAVSYVGTVHLTSTDANAVLPANYQFVSADKGVHTFNSVKLTTTGTQTVTAKSTTNYPASITGTSNSILVKHQYLITMNFAGNPVGSVWVDQGSSYTVSVNSPVYVGGVSLGSMRFVCTGNVIDGGALTAGTSYTFINVQAAHTITFEWKEQWLVSFDVSGLGNDAVGTVLTDGTTSYTYSQGLLVPVSPGSGPFGWYDTISPTYHWTQDVPGSNGIRYDLRTVVTAVPGLLFILATYQPQYQLTMATNSGTTSPSLGYHWYDAGSKVTIRATSPFGSFPRFQFNGWAGSGSGAYTGLSNPATITMNAPITENAKWTIR